MKNNVLTSSTISTLVQDTKEHLKVIFDYNKHSTNIICEGYILSQLGTQRRFLPTHGRSDTVELHDGTIYYYINSTIHSTELSELLIAEPDYLFNLYLLLPDRVFSTLIYIQYECEYFNFGTNRFYSPFNIHEYLTNTI